MELYLKVRVACDRGMSQREAARHFGISRDTVRKMMAYSVPPGYRRQAPVRRPKLDAFIPIIDRELWDAVHSENGGEKVDHGSGGIVPLRAA